MWGDAALEKKVEILRGLEESLSFKFKGSGLKKKARKNSVLPYVTPLGKVSHLQK